MYVYLEDKELMKIVLKVIIHFYIVIIVKVIVIL